MYVFDRRYDVVVCIGPTKHRFRRVLSPSCHQRHGSALTEGTRVSIPGSSKTGFTDAKGSAFTCPPRFRNSGTFVHGTHFRHFTPIMEQGLKASVSEIFMIDEVRTDGRVPGLNDPPELLIFIDENKAISADMKFDYDPREGTWKTKGIQGVIRPWFFQKVVDQRPATRGNVLFQSKEDPAMGHNRLRSPRKLRRLLHATYWENVVGIMQEGIVPAKNPHSEIRRPLAELLRSAENHVYAVNEAAVDHLRERGGYYSNAASREDSPAVKSACSEGGSNSSSPSLQPTYRLDIAGLDRPADAVVVIDAEKAQEMGFELEVVQSADREDTVYIKGRVPPEVIVGVEANAPVDLPAHLEAKIVDPKSFHDIPIIDLSNPDESKVLSQLRYACEVVGFMQIVGHGVSEELVTRQYEAQKAFFRLPEAKKQQIATNEESPVRGWFGKGAEDLDGVSGNEVLASSGAAEIKQKRSVQDNKEGLDMNGVPWSKQSSQSSYVGRAFGMPSQLPREGDVPGFRAAVREYQDQMFGLSRRLLRLMAKVLELDVDFFEKHITRPVATHRLLHYWPMRNFKTEIGVGAHTDYGLLTILKQDDVGGLQVLNARDRTWVHALVVPGAFVINVGDMLARWTGHRFKSTVHRVVNISPAERYSVPYFLEPNLDTMIRPGELCPRGPPEARVENCPNPHTRRCRLRKWWDQVREVGEPVSAEIVLGRFYEAAGLLKKRG